MPRMPLILLDGESLIVFSAGNASGAYITSLSSGTLLFQTNGGSQFNTNGFIGVQSLFNPSASSSTWGFDVSSSGSLASNLLVRHTFSGASTNCFTMYQDASSNLIYSFDGGFFAVGGAIGTTTGVISAGTGFRINNAAGNGTFLRGNGTNYIAGSIIMSDISSGTLGISLGGTGNTSYTTNAVIYYNGSVFTSDSNLIYSSGTPSLQVGNIAIAGGTVIQLNYSGSVIVQHAVGQTLLNCPDSSAGVFDTLIQAGGFTVIGARWNGAVMSFGVFGSVSARPSAYTQTYSTTSRTMANLTSSAVATTASTNATPFGYTTAAQADAIVTAINALRTDVNNVKNNVNQICDDLQGYGFLT